MKINRERIFKIIQIGSRTDIPSTVFDIFISLTILVCITVTFMQTFDQFRDNPYLHMIESVTIVIFIVEYIFRLYTADFLYPDVDRGKATLKFIISFAGMIDLLTIVSYYVPLWFTSGVVALRMLRVLRIARLFQLGAGYDAFDIIFNVLKDKKNQIISSVIMILLLMFMSSMLMYSIEHDAQPEAFANGFSGLWWAMSTILTVGYGDIYPITTLGQIMSIVIAFLGVGLVAMPTGIISAGFVEYYQRDAAAKAKHKKKRNSGEGSQEDAAAAGITKTEETAGNQPGKSAANNTAGDPVMEALRLKQEAQPLVNGCCPLCHTDLNKMRPAYCPVCGQRLL